VRAREVGKKLPTFSLETAVRFSDARAQGAFVEELANTVANLVAKYQSETAEGGRWFRLALGAHPALDVPPESNPEPPTNHD
jgi:hypothetical protein